MSRVKREHRNLENLLYSTEKLMSAAELGGAVFPSESRDSAERALLLSEFHDILPGTLTENGEKNALHILASGIETVCNLRTRALFSLISREIPATEGEYPIFLFHYQPYALKAVVESEFQLADQNWSEQFAFVRVFQGDREIPCQQIKEESTLHLDWRKKIVFAAELEPMRLNRYSVRIEMRERTQANRNAETDFCGKFVQGKIGDESGALESLVISDRAVFCGATSLLMYDDSADPWAMREEELFGLGKNPVPFRLLSADESAAYSGTKQLLAPVRVIEDGDVMKSIEAVFGCGNSKARIEYRFYRELPYVDLTVDLDFFEKNKLVRLRIPFAPSGRAFGDVPFGIEDKFEDGREVVYQKWIGMNYGSHCAGIANLGTYGGRVSGEGIELTLLRGAGYCFHPIYDRELYPQDRYLPRIDTGSHKFQFRIFLGRDGAELCRRAEEFNQPPYAFNAFPTGGEGISSKALEIGDPDVILSAFKRSAGRNGHIVRLFNASNAGKSCAVSLCGSRAEFAFAPYEVKTLIYADGFTELDEMEA